ncbi:MAG: divalent-cation tolerance protein CutA [Candidatus Omnitrophica bacterium]|nr:divalent-cation tolerance protein CutA [Candidatus Omnitrophota bacterium]
MYMIVFITCSSEKEGRKIAQELLKKKLAACVNIVKNIESFFWWKARIDQTKEVLLVIKSKKNKFTQIIKAVKFLHSYTVPEIIALPIIGGNKDYLRWIDDSVR